jgi:hypothetical protein
MKYNEEKYREREIYNIQKKAKHLGLAVTLNPPLLCEVSRESKVSIVLTNHNRVFGHYEAQRPAIARRRHFTFVQPRAN